MRKILGLLVLATLVFTSCGDDDDSPDYTLKDKSEIIGNHQGKLKITVNLMNAPTKTMETDVRFQKTTTNDNQLNLFTNELGGPIIASDFKKSKDYDFYTFNLANIAKSVFIGNEIPDFYHEWYSIYDISKIELIGLTLDSRAKYVRASNTMSFTYKGMVYIYQKVDGIDKKVSDSNITLEYYDLKK
ncbi:hypothetical protein [Dysgonomonas sp. 216]|uniref:hypothetical protein n=1 Tax=Dysgonomonas sp. 216 TaxID=2302934 RepID=UPI0013D09164|nr:hypothetical protein [Dysgonomonas sp. 216]